MTVKVGIIGTGFANSVQIPAFEKHRDYEIVAIYGNTPSKASKIAKERKIHTVHEDWRDLVSDPEVDLVSVVSPVHQHYEMTVSAINHGKHVLCEKPMAFNVDEAVTMLQELDSTGRVGMINHEFRQLPERRYFHDLVHQGTLGDIYQINVDVSSPSRLPSRTGDRNWNWWADIHHGGGLWGALGSHLIDFILWTFDGIDRISGTLSTNNTHLNDRITGQNRLVTSDDSFSSMFVTRKGIQGKLSGSTTRHGDSGTLIEAFGSDSALRITRDRTVWKAEGDEWQQLEIPEEYQLRELQEDEPWLIPPFEKLLDHLIVGIESRKSPSPSFEDGVNVQFVLDALRQSFLNRSWISI